jgi:lipoate-protein ligase A
MKTQKLFECCSFFSGGTPTKGKEEYWRGDIPWFSPKDIKHFDLAVSQDRISVSAIESSATRLVELGTILVVGRSGVLAHTLPVGIVRQPSAFIQDIKAIVPDGSYDPEFIALYLKANTELAANLFRATQTEEKLRREEIRGKKRANQTHFKVGRKVRQTIEELGGTMPEALPTPDQSIKQIESSKKKLEKKK